jgi:hypothetical protein
VVVGLYVVDAHPGVDSHPGDPENVSLLGHPPSGFCDGVHGDIGLRECGHDRELPVIAPSDYPPAFPEIEVGFFGEILSDAGEDRSDYRFLQGSSSNCTQDVMLIRAA